MADKEKENNATLEQRDQPWFLEPIYEYKGKGDNCFKYKCRLCPSNKEPMKAHPKSRSNLRRHLEIHNSKKAIEKFDELCKQKMPRKTTCKTTK